MKIKVKTIKGVTRPYLEVYYGKDCYLVTKNDHGLSYELCKRIMELEVELKKAKEKADLCECRDARNMAGGMGSHL